MLNGTCMCQGWAVSSTANDGISDNIITKRKTEIFKMSLLVIWYDI